MKREFKKKPREKFIIKISQDKRGSIPKSKKKSPREFNFLGMSVKEYQSKSKEEKLKTYYKARQSISNPELYNTIIRQKELECVTRDLGVDYKLEKERYGFFIEMVLNAKLPSGWSKELQKDNTLYYFNSKNGSYSYSHPCLNYFRNLMRNEYKKVLRSFSSGYAKSHEPPYTDQTFTYLEGGPLRDMTLFKLSKYFSKGKRSNLVVRYEEMIENLTKIYEELYSYDFDNLKLKLKKMMPMKFCGIEETKEAIKLFNIREIEPELVWVARFYVSLPLPPDWEIGIPKVEEKGRIPIYKNWFNNMKIEVKPCYFYIRNLIQICKKNREKTRKISRIWMVGNDHIFEDGFSRIHAVENFKLFEDKFTKQKVKSRVPSFRNFIFEKDREIKKKYQDANLIDPFVEKIEKYTKNPDLQDSHLILILKQLELDPNDIKNAHLFFFIYNFLMKKRVESNWKFRNPEKGESYWINHQLKRISGLYPFIDELAKELKMHNTDILIKDGNSRRKKLGVLKTVLKVKSEKEALKRLCEIRKNYTQAYVDSRTEYNFQLYAYLKKKLQEKILKYEKLKKFAMEEDVLKDIRERPKFKNFIMQPFDTKKLAKKLVNSVTSDEIKDLIFYNFFNLDVYNRKAMGDEVLKLGARDVLKLYENRIRDIKKRRRARVIADEIIEEIEILAEVDNDEVERMVDDALRLIDLASQLKPNDDLRSILDEELDENFENDKNFLKLKLDFFKRYGKAGEKLRQRIIDDKWDRVKNVQEKIKKKKRRKSKMKKKKKIKPRFRKVSKRFNRTNTSVASEYSQRSINSHLKHALEVDNMTVLGGELHTVNTISSDDEEKINIFAPIKNKKTKKKFRKAINKTRNIMGYIKKSKRHSFAQQPNKNKMNAKRRYTSYKRTLTTEEAIPKKSRFISEQKLPFSKNEIHEEIDHRFKKKVLYQAIRGFIRKKQKDGILVGYNLPEEKKKYKIKNYSKLRRNTSLQSNLEKPSKKKSMIFVNEGISGIKKLVHQTTIETKLKSGSQDSSLSGETESCSAFSGTLEGISSVGSESGEEEDLEDDFKPIRLVTEEEKQFTDLKKQIDENLGKDIVHTISSKITSTFMKVLKKRKLKAKEELNHKRLLNRLIITSLKGKFNGISPNKKEKIKKMIKRETQRLAEKETVNAPGDILFDLFKEFRKTEDGKNKKSEEDKEKEDKVEKILMKAKLYDFKSGKMKKVAKNKMLEVLHQFDKFYEHMTNEELVNKAKSGEFDHESLLDLLKRYLDKVMSEFDGWTKKDKARLEEIIQRTKKAFFAHKLKKRFISNKKDYVKMNVFDRLNNMETFSLKRLFSTIKNFLMRFRATYREERDVRGKAVVYELRAPKPYRIDTMVKLQHEIEQKSIDELGVIKKDIENERLCDYVLKIYKKSQEIGENENFFEFYIKSQKTELNEFYRLKRAIRMEHEALKLKDRYNNIDEILEKICARALFELIDFSKLKTIPQVKETSQAKMINDNLEKVKGAFEGKNQPQGKRINSNPSLLKATIGINLETLVDNQFSEKSKGNLNSSMMKTKEDNYLKKNLACVNLRKLKFSKVNLEFTTDILGSKRKTGRSKKKKKDKKNKIPMIDVQKPYHTHRSFVNKPQKEMRHRTLTERKSNKKKFSINRNLPHSSRSVSQQRKRSLYSSRTSAIRTRKSKKLSTLRLKSQKKNSKISKKSLKRRIKEDSLARIQNHNKKKRVSKVKKIRNEGSSKLELSIKSNMFIPYLNIDKVNQNRVEETSDLNNEGISIEEQSVHLHTKNSVKNHKRNKGRISKRLDSIHHKFHNQERSELLSEFSDIHFSKKINFDEKSEPTPVEHTSFVKASVDEKGVIKGPNFLKKPEIQNSKIENKKPKEYFIQGESLSHKIRVNNSYKIFNKFRKYNHDLISRAKLSLMEILTHECLSRLAQMDSSFISEFKRKVERRLASFMKNEIYLSGDFMKDLGQFKVANQNDYRRMPNSVFLSPDYKICLRDLNIDVRKIG